MNKIIKSYIFLIVFLALGNRSNNVYADSFYTCKSNYIKNIESESNTNWYEDYVYRIEDGKIYLKKYIGNESDIIIHKTAIWSCVKI